MPKIIVMDNNLANKIAAGEVVEKTMNVVKELVENSIDAGATSIKIELKDSGVKEIIITDDGTGMEKDDAILAFSRHATSKLKTIDDLFNIESLGFRGEALPSIASVSNVLIKTSTGQTGTEIKLEGGVIQYVKSSDLVKGTKIIVNDLFYNTPVRLKYLKNLYIELANIVEYVNKIALSFPNIKFVLINNDKQLLNTEGKGNLLKVINNIFGIEITKKMIEIKNSNSDYNIFGYIAYPEMTKSNRNSIITFVNGRYIKNNELNRIIIDCYHTYVPIDKYPIVVLSIETDPILIDINIHPTKMDIKFSKLDTLKELVEKTIKDKLENLTLIPNATSKIAFPEIFNDNNDEKEKFVIEEPVDKYNNLEEITFNFDEQSNNQNHENRIKKMYPVGLVHSTYIICENEDGMYILDQHAVAERINYEKYFKAMSEKKNDTIGLLIPIQIELPSNESIILKENIKILEELGFEIEEFGISTYIIRRHPTWLPSYALEESINKIINIVVQKEKFDYSKFIEHVAITLACKLSIKANDFITMEDIEILLDNLRKTENPFTCPHGRPTIISYSKYDLEKMFKRVMN